MSFQSSTFPQSLNNWTERVEEKIDLFFGQIESNLAQILEAERQQLYMLVLETREIAGQCDSLEEECAELRELVKLMCDLRQGKQY